MATVRFYLRAPQADPNPDDTRLLSTSVARKIYLKFNYRGQELMYGVGESVSPRNWDKRRQRLKDNKATTIDGDHAINDLLDTLASILKKEYNRLLASGIPHKGVLKNHLDSYMEAHVRPAGNRAVKHEIFDLIDRMADGDLTGEKSASTRTTYRTSKKHLFHFQQKHKSGLRFSDITVDFKYKYEAFLKELRLSPNSVKKEFKNLKTFMNMAVDLELTANVSYKKKAFSVQGAETDGVYLTDQDITILVSHDFAQDTRLARIRDFFVFMCNVGLRFGDAATLKQENLVVDGSEMFIKTTTGKTNKKVTIYLNDTVKRILQTYHGFPPAPSNQKFNQYVKEVCEKAGLTMKGRLDSDPNARLCDCVGSHTARRTYITNLIQKEIDPIAIRRATGHSGGRIFEGYIKESNDEAAKRLGRSLRAKSSAKSAV